MYNMGKQFVMGNYENVPWKLVQPCCHTTFEANEEEGLEKCQCKCTLFHQAQNNDQLQFHLSFNELGIFINFASVHICFNFYDACKFVLKCKCACN